MWSVVGRLVHAELNAESETRGLTTRAGDRDLGVLSTSDSNHVCGLGSPGNEKRSELWMKVENSSYLRNGFRKKSPGKRPKSHNSDM